MTLRQLSRTTAVSAALAMSTPVWAQQPGHQIGTAQTQPAPSTTSGQTSQMAVAECAQAQPHVMRTIDAANMRLETARQNNSPPAMRAAVDDLQDALRQLRAQLAACAGLQAAAPAGPQAGHTMPSTPQPPGMSVVPPGSPSPAPAAATPGAPPAKPADPHAGHTPAPKPGATAPKPTAPAAKPADPHSGYAPAPAKPSATKPSGAGAKPGAPAPKPADPHAGHAMPSAPAAPTKLAAPVEMKGDVPKEAIDPVSGMTVDPATAPSTTYKGKIYYFSSAQDRLKFIRNPETYLRKGPGRQ